MNHPGRIKIRAVAATDIERHRSALVAFNELTHQPSPGAVLYAPLPELVCRHHAGRKDQHGAIVPQMFVYLFDTADIAAGGLAG